jgi:hypothetical protein
MSFASVWATLAVRLMLIVHELIPKEGYLFRAAQPSGAKVLVFVLRLASVRINPGLLIEIP